jgi:uncharacterized cupin superfamily protein
VTTPTFRAAELSDEELEDWGDLEPPLATATGAPMPTHGLDLWVSDDESISTGTWQCAPGPSRWEFTDNGEFVHVLTGRMTCRHDDGTEVGLSAGSTAVFPKGWTGTWEVHETLRKVYVIFT